MMYLPDETTPIFNRENEMSHDYKTEVQRGMELLELCQELQSARDGIDRPKPGVIDKTKTLDQFARDISAAMTNMSALQKLIPMMLQLGELGRKLEADGKITVEYGDDYSTAALNYICSQHGAK